MAKKIPLDHQAGEGMLKMGKDDPIEENFKLKSLMTLPEARKLITLADEMTKVLKAKAMDSTDRIRKHDTTLAKFKKNQEAVARSGFLSTPNITHLTQQLVNFLRVLVNSQDGSNNTDEEPLDDFDHTILRTPPFTGSRSEVGADRFFSVSSPDEPISVEQTHGRHKNVIKKSRNPRNILSGFQTPSVSIQNAFNIDKHPHEDLLRYLSENGFQIDRLGDVKISPDSGLYKRSRYISKADLDSALAYISSSSTPKKSPNGRIKNVISDIYYVLEGGEDDAVKRDMKAKYPNLKNFYTRGVIKTSKNRSKIPKRLSNNKPKTVREMTGSGLSNWLTLS